MRRSVVSAPVARIVSAASAVLLLLLILLCRPGIVGVHCVSAVAADKTAPCAPVLRLTIVFSCVFGAGLLFSDWHLAHSRRAYRQERILDFPYGLFRTDRELQILLCDR